MIKDKKVEKLENSAVKLTVTVDQDAVAKEYKDLVSGYAKNAQIKGFRKGKVPTEVLERKFGDSFRFETMQKVLEESLRTVFDEIDEKPLPYSQPSLEEEVDLAVDSDFTYTVSYDVYPDITLGEYRNLEVKIPNVSLTKDDEKRELTALQEQNAIVQEKSGGVVEKDTIVTVDFWELDEDGNEKEDTRREDFVFTQGTGYNLYKIDDDIVGMKVDEEKTIEKTYDEDFENPELAGRTLKLVVKIKGVRERQLPEIDDELAQDISDEYETLDDLKASIRSRLETTLENSLRQRKIDAIMEKVVEDSSVELPESMIQAELEAAWQNFVGQFRGQEDQVLRMLEAQESGKEKMLEQWKPGAEERLKRRLLIQRMLEKEDISVEDEELDGEIERLAEENNTDAATVRNYYEQNNLMDYLRQDLRERKLFDSIFEDTKFKKGEKMSFMDLTGQNQ